MTPGPSFTMPAPSSEEPSLPSSTAPSSGTSAPAAATTSNAERLVDNSGAGSTQPKQCARCGQQLDLALERQPLLLADSASTSAPSPSSFAFAPHPARPSHRLPPHQNLTSAINAAAAVALSRHLASEEGFATNQDGNPICSQCAVQLAGDTHPHTDVSDRDVEMTETSQQPDEPLRPPTGASESSEEQGHEIRVTADPGPTTHASAFPPLTRSDTSPILRTPSSPNFDASQRSRLRFADGPTRAHHTSERIDTIASSSSNVAGLGRSGSFSRSLSYHGSGSDSAVSSSVPVVVSFPSSSSLASASASLGAYLAGTPAGPSVAHSRSRSSSNLSANSTHDVPAPAHAIPGGVKQRRPSSARRLSRSGSSAGPTNIPLAAVAAHSESRSAVLLEEAKHGPNAVTRPRLSNIPMHVIASELHQSAQNSRPPSLASSASAVPTTSSLHDLHRATKYHADPMTMDDGSRGKDPFAFSPEGLRWFDPYKPDPTLDVSRLRSPPRGRGCLYPGATFNGTQKSGRNSYDVTVRIVNVDLETSHLCGYLNIRGLTEDWPELTTYFDAEIIGDRYGFVTGKWGATEADDLKHWARFPPFRPLRSALSKPGLRFNHLNKPFVFMRWKEKFLVPDHRVRDINGASFAGFYYVCVELGDSAGRPPTQSEANRGRSNSILSSNAGSPPASSSSLFSTSPPTNSAGSLLTTGSLSSTAAATGQQWYAARTQRRRELSLSSPQYPIHTHGHHFPPLHSPPPPTAGPGFWPSSPTSPTMPSAISSAMMQEEQFPPFPSISGVEFDDLGAAGKMSGFYFHENSEPYQQLSLHHTAEATSSSFEMR